MKIWSEEIEACYHCPNANVIDETCGEILPKKIEDYPDIPAWCPLPDAKDK